MMMVMVSCDAMAVSYAKVVIDPTTEGVMSSTYLAHIALESQSADILEEILSHYESAAKNNSIVFMTKYLDRRAMENAGLFANEENYYYQRIYSLVKDYITPKLFRVTFLMVKYPDQALCWGPFLVKVTEECKQLCEVFSVVCTNGKHTFSDVTFLRISDEFKELFDLTHLGGIDWKRMLNNFSTSLEGFSIDELREELSMISAKTIAAAGGEVIGDLFDSVTGAPVFGSGKKTFDVRRINDTFNTFKDAYEILADPRRFGQEVAVRLSGSDSAAVAALLRFDGRIDLGPLISQITADNSSRFYRQVWQIKEKGVSGETVVSYEPPGAFAEITPSPTGFDQRIEIDDEFRNEQVKREWTLYTGTGTPSSSFLAGVKQNSEYYAGGWSQAKVDQLNKQQQGYIYSITYWLRHTTIRERENGTMVTKHYYAYAIKVTKELANGGVVYEETFDSQYDNEGVFAAKMDAKRAVYEDSLGRELDIVRGEKHYYDAVTADRIKGSESATFSMECVNHSKLGEGAFSWRENSKQGRNLDVKSTQYAMRTSLGDETDYAGIDSQIGSLGDLVSSTQSELEQVQGRISELERLLAQSSINDAEGYRQELYQCRQQRDSLAAVLVQYQSQYNEAQAVRDSLREDYLSTDDATYRLPHVMHELEANYGMSWDDEGIWSIASDKCTYVRHGHMNNISSVVVFTAVLTKTRSERRFLGIRYQRAILAVSWEMNTTYGSSQIVDVLDLKGYSDDNKKAKAVDDRLRALQKEHEECDIAVTYSRPSSDDVGADNDKANLLWVSDRLAIARQVEARLSAINAELTVWEKKLRLHGTVLDRMEHLLGVDMRNLLSRPKRSDLSYRRWYYASRSANLGIPLNDILAADAELLESNRRIDHVLDSLENSKKKKKN